jgi:hypothetical protein
MTLRLNDFRHLFRDHTAYQNFVTELLRLHKKGEDVLVLDEADRRTARTDFQVQFVLRPLPRSAISAS